MKREPNAKKDCAISYCSAEGKTVRQIAKRMRNRFREIGLTHAFESGDSAEENGVAEFPLRESRASESAARGAKNAFGGIS